MADDNRGGEDDAFGRFYRVHYDPVRSYARCLTDDPDVDDLVADTFVVAMHRHAEITPGRERVWLFGVARNIARTRRRSRDRSAKLTRVLVDLRPPTTTDLGNGWRTDIALLRDALRELRAEEREILVLATWHDVAARELAEILGISPATARVRLHRARARLSAILNDSESTATSDEPIGTNAGVRP